MVWSAPAAPRVREASPSLAHGGDGFWGGLLEVLEGCPAVSYVPEEIGRQEAAGSDRIGIGRSLHGLTDEIAELRRGLDRLNDEILCGVAEEPQGIGEVLVQG
jgi:hypothetical protein